MSMLTRYSVQSAIVLRATIVGGKRGLPVVHLSGLQVTTPQPLTGQDSGAILQRIGWDTPHTAWECFMVGHPDVINGDTLHIAGKAYTVRSVAQWSPFSVGEKFLHIILEEVDQ